MFKFHKIGNDVASGWYCLVDSQEALDAHTEHMSKRTLTNWKDIKNSPDDKGGHCRTVEAGQYKYLLQTHMEFNNIEKMDMVDCLDFISGSLKSSLEVFKREGEVYVAENGACRPSTKLLDCESILEERELDDYVYPHHSEKDFKIRKWQGGRHYYILENGNSITLDGRTKWNTCQGAEDALADHLNKLGLQDMKNRLEY